MDARRFVYRPRWALLIGCLAVLTLMSIGVLFMATEPARSHGLGRLLVKLNLDAKLIIKSVGWVGLAFCAAGAYGLYVMQTYGERFVEIASGRIRAPVSGYSAKVMDLPFAEIQQVSLQKVQSTKIIHIQHPSGTLRLANVMFPEKGAFDELINILKTETNSALT